MTTPEDEELRAITKAFEAADDAFQADLGTIFGSESERKKQFFNYLKWRGKSWGTPGPCMYRGCKEMSILRSHSIHKAGSIEQISEQRHVLTPMLNEHGEMTLKRVGVNEASTFPGFCETHEQIFSEFERAGKIIDGHQATLQAFRTLCREIVRKRADNESGERSLNDFRAVRFSYFKAAILESAPDAKVEAVSYEGHAIEDAAVSQLDQGRADLEELEGMYDEFFQYIESGEPEPCLQALNIPMELPVSLSGLGVLWYKDDTGEHRALCLLGVLPQGNHTLTFIGTARRHCDAVSFYTGKMEHGFGALNAIESWILNGSDHWFIKPSAWEGISESRRAKIRAALLSDDYTIGSDATFSILNDARRWIIRYVQENLSEADDQTAALERLSIENAKLSA